jgi:O-methyltransferase
LIESLPETVVERHALLSRRPDAVRYLDLLKRAVNQYLYLGESATLDNYQTHDSRLYADFQWKVPTACRPHSLLDRQQLDLLEYLVLDVHARQVPGSLLEAGVWRGGAIVLMCALTALFTMGRKVIAADSFAGIPRSQLVRGDPVDHWRDRWEAGLDEVRANIDRYGLLDNNVQFIVGNFSSSLPDAQIGPLALLRIDADSFESTTAVLECLHDKVSPQGIILVDDGHLPGCALAVLEYRRRRRIRSPLQRAGNNLFWVK